MSDLPLRALLLAISFEICLHVPCEADFRDSDLVPGESIQPRWIDGETLEFTRPGKNGPARFQISGVSGELTEVITADRQDLRPSLATKSRGQGTEINLRFVNEMPTPLDLIWIDAGGKSHRYGRIAPGQQRKQHTFEGHAWRLTSPDRDDRVEFIAPSHDGIARINRQTVDQWRTLKEAARSRRTKQRDSEEMKPSRTAMVQDHDLWCREPDGSMRILADDGEPGFGWGRITASPDGRFVLAFRTREAQRHPVTLIDVTPEDGIQPRNRTLEYLKPGDRIAHPHPSVFDLEQGRRIDLDPALVPNPWSINRISWHPDGDRVRMLYNERGHQTLRLVEIDVRDGTSRTLIEETSPTFVDYAGKLHLQIMADGDRALWMSERSGWNHLESVDLDTGERQSLTSGDWVVRAVDDIDAEAGTARIRILGLDPEQDPYHVHHAIIDLRTGEMTRLTRGDGTHDLDFSPDGRYYVDRWSRVDLPPVHELRRTADGALIAELARADDTPLRATGWLPPERFVAKGRDDQTDIWGVIIRPPRFDPDDSYPVIEHIYAGPHGHFVPKSWSRSRRMREAADLGAVVVQIDGMGTNWRSKAFHDVAWRNLGDSGFPDRIGWMKEAAETRPWMDLDRVGIYGGSAGGQSAMRALLAHGDFYDVAVADCGCHDNRMDKIWWNELWMGWPIGPHYEEQSNVTQAHRLQGELMLILGGLDSNVDPASTLQVVDALVKANKNFEFVLLPTAGHGAAETAYGHRRRLDFLKRKLITDF